MHSAYSDTDGTLYEAFPQSTSRAHLEGHHLEADVRHDSRA